MKFYEIYVAGNNGFSAFVKTELENYNEDEILNRAIDAKVIAPLEARDLRYNGGTVNEREEKDSEFWNII